MKRKLIIRLTLLIVCTLSFNMAAAQNVKKKTDVKKPRVYTKQEITDEAGTMKVESKFSSEDKKSAILLESEAMEIEKNQKQERKVYDVVENMPSFPGGTVALSKWISENLTYPAEAKDKNIEGRVIVGFVVEKDGSITNVSIKRSVDPLLDQEAMNLIKRMQKWNPGKQNNEPVAVNYNIPVVFKLNGNQ